MKRFFEPVLFHRTDMAWDYNARFDLQFKGYYHWHQCPEILLVHEGQGTVIMSRQTYQIRPGMLFIFQPYQLHHVYAEVSPETPYTRSICYLEPAAAEKLLRPFPNRLALFKTLINGGSQEQAFDMTPRLDALSWIYSSYNHAFTRDTKDHSRNSEELGLFLVQLLTCLDQVRQTNSPPHPGHKPLGYSETIMRYIEEHYQEDVSLGRLSEETHLSETYISRVFRRETGGCISEYLTARRIKHACGLLERTELSVESIGQQSGFSNVSHFIQTFKRQIGVTPLQYRKKQSL
jgi:AraC-like DNA-binding protein